MRQNVNSSGSLFFSHLGKDLFAQGLEMQQREGNESQGQGSRLPCVVMLFPNWGWHSFWWALKSQYMWHELSQPRNNWCRDDYLRSCHICGQTGTPTSLFGCAQLPLVILHLCPLAGILYVMGIRLSKTKKKKERNKKNSEGKQRGRLGIVGLIRAGPLNQYRGVDSVVIQHLCKVQWFK